MDILEIKSINGPPMKNKKPSLNESISRSRTSSVTGSTMPRTEEKENRRTLLNPKLLEMVFKTINKRPSLAGEFQQGLAKTATKTWTTHLIQRKRMVKKQKVLEDIAANLGLAKGFRTEFQDEAERLVSLLFKEIEKKKPTEEEISSEEFSEEISVEEESDESIHSYKEILEPLPKSQPKAPVIRPEVQPHQHHSPYITTHKRDMYYDEPVAEILVRGTPKPFGLSFMNVTKIEVHPGSKPKEMIGARRKPLERTYTEVTRRSSELKSADRKGKKLSKKERPKRQDFKVEKTPSPLTEKIDEYPQTKAIIDQPSKPWKGIKDVSKPPTTRPLVAFREPGESGDLKGLRSTGELEILKSKRTTASSESTTASIESVLRSSESRRRLASSKLLQKKLEQVADEELDEKTKEYVIKQIKGMLRILADRKLSSALAEPEFIKKRRRERKSVFVLWKNHFDVKNEENMAEVPVGLKKNKRDNLMKDVDDQMSKASFLGETSGRSQYEKNMWQYLVQKAKMLYSDKERNREKVLKNKIQVLEELDKKSRTPDNIILEEERRQKALNDYQVNLNPPRDKYGVKRPNTRETTMEEILQMRGFRGPAKNCKNTIWIRKPDFIGYLKPMKRQPKIVYNSPKTKLSNLVSKRKAGDSRTVTKPPEDNSESDFFPHKILIKRTPVIGEYTVAEPQPQFPTKRSKPCVEVERGFKKYFGSLDGQEGSQTPSGITIIK